VTTSRSHSAPHRPRIAFVLSDVAPCRIGFFEHLAETSDFEIVVLYHDSKRPGHQWDSPLQGAAFPHKELSCIKYYFQTAEGDVWPRHFPIGLWKELLQGRYDAIVVLNWTEIYTLVSLVLGKLMGTPVVLWEDSIPHPATRLKRALAPLIRWMFRAYDAMVAMSTKCKEYLIELGARPETVFLSAYVVDVKQFRPNLTQLERNERKSRAGIEQLVGRDVIIFVGQFIKRKGIEELLQAFRQIAEERPDTVLLMVGEGPLRGRIEEFAVEHGLRNQIVLPGYVQQQRLLAFYSAADVFVLPSTYESFGAVIIEAMSCGLPIITTETVGATPDAVKHGFNGLVVPPGDADALHAAILDLLVDEKKRLRMAEASLEIMAHWTIERSVTGFCMALNHCLGSNGPTATVGIQPASGS
jgi:glycosyltransferase involved in cell wall biosynthesis